MGQQRDVVGSAAANAWLHALGGDLPEEIIILPDDGPKRLETHTTRTVEWPTDLSMDVFPNPSSGPAMVAYEVPEGMEQTELHVLDVYGRVLLRQRLGQGPGLVELSTGGLASGVYLVDLRLNGQSLAQTKLIVQR
ncbi:MAG: T9SS type A sorting domain-containing protein [Flavobacteriales bacterium]|nr:T9SS type A sorting domain-containing protein [Flavobacteriales bacterium]